MPEPCAGTDPRPLPGASLPPGIRFPPMLPQIPTVRRGRGTATRTQVMRAMREMDYVGDARAKAVAGVDTPTLAFVPSPAIRARR